MKSAIRLIVLVLIIFISQSGFSQDQASTTDPNNIINAYNEFGCDLFNKLSSKNEASFDSLNTGKSNIFISPLSLALNMAMVYNGAEKETESAIAKTLHISGTSPEELNAKSKKLIDLICHKENFGQIKIANSIWLSESKKWEFKNSFLNTIDEFYYAKAFRGLNSDTINHWISEKTNGRIGYIDFKFDDLSAAVILNTIYFKEKWAYPFRLEKTDERDFYLCDGSKKRIEMMRQSDGYKYHENDDFQEVEIRFRSDFGLVIFLPKNDSCLENWDIKELYEEFTQNNKSVFGYVEIPKFTIKFEMKLKNILSELEMEIAFDMHNANFTEMADFDPQSNLYIGEIIHSTFLQINETGAEAAATTSTHMKFFASSQPKKIIINKPFYIVLRNRKNNAILFIGAIYDPQKI